MATHWNPGDVVIRRERLGLWPPEVPMADGVNDASAHLGVWLEVPTLVVADNDEWLITYTAPGAPFGSPTVDGQLPTDATRGTHGRGGPAMAV